MKTTDIEMQKVDELVYANLTVPVYQAACDILGAYPGFVVRNQDLPDDLRDVFDKSQVCAQIPFSDACYLHDFTGFMERGGKSWYYDGSSVAANYLYPPIKALLCSCCGGITRGKQWHNRDIGYGLCSSCADWIKLKFKKSEKEMLRCYGEHGVHYCVK